MDSLQTFGLEATRWLQANYPQLEGILSLLSQLGRFQFYLAVTPLIYWCIHKRFGRQLSYLLALSNIVNLTLKHLLRLPRPYWQDPAVGLDAETTYGLPSGHAQTAMLAYSFVSAWVRRRWVWVLCALIIVFMGLSRVFLGVHYVHDVIAGMLLGGLILVGYFVWQHTFQERFGNRILGQRLLLAVSVPIFFAVVYIAGRVLIGAPDDTVAWSAFIPDAELELVEEVTAAIAILLGLGVGFILEASRVHFLVDGSWQRRLGRYLFGIVVTLALWRGLALVLPESPLWLGLPLRFVRYWLTALWVAYYGPWAFVRLNLADASPEPEVKLSVSEGGIMRG